MKRAGSLAVLVCDDVGAGPASLDLGLLVDRLRDSLPGAEVVVVPGLCEKGLADVVSEVGAERVVVGCRSASHRRAGMLAALARSGVASAGAALVDLRPAPDGCAHVVLEQTVTVVEARAAALRVEDLGRATRQRTVLAKGVVSRRGLFRGDLVHTPVAVWTPGRCDAGGCASCVLACPHGALSATAGNIAVLADRCTGCGACVSVCRTGALTLLGGNLDSLGVAAAIYAKAISVDQAAGGVAIVCRDASSPPLLGEAWLALQVPSLAAVTGGWLLQLTSRGVPLRLVACDDPVCERRAASLYAFHRELMNQAPCPLPPPATGPPATGDTVPLQLREPEATTEALEALGALPARSAGWRVSGDACPVGLVSVSEAGCSGCERCTAVCPTKALHARRDDGGVLQLYFDARRCTACRACAVTCPEGVIGLERVADSNALTAGSKLAATVVSGTCRACGNPLLAGLSRQVMRSRLGTSTPSAATMPNGVCADCRLAGRERHQLAGTG